MTTFPSKSKAHVRLLTSTDGWISNPPTAQQVREQLLSGHKYAHGQVLAAAYIAHAAADPVNVYDRKDMWKAGTRVMMGRWSSLFRQRSDHWSYWWWRRLYWTTWSNTRQWLIHADSGCVNAVHLDYEIYHQCLYRTGFRSGSKYVGVHMPIKKPSNPSHWFGYIWRNVPEWPEITLEKKNGILFERSELMKWGVKGKHFLINDQWVISEKQLRTLVYPTTQDKMHDVKFRQVDNWLAVTCDVGIALVAIRAEDFIPPYTLEEDEKIL